MIAVDKQLHFWSSLALTLAFALYVGLMPAFFTVLSIGALKELWWDFYLKRGTPDHLDMLANAAGIAAACALFMGARA